MPKRLSIIIPSTEEKVYVKKIRRFVRRGRPNTLHAYIAFKDFNPLTEDPIDVHRVKKDEASFVRLSSIVPNARKLIFIISIPKTLLSRTTFVYEINIESKITYKDLLSMYGQCVKFGLDEMEKKTGLIEEWNDYYDDYDDTIDWDGKSESLYIKSLNNSLSIDDMGKLMMDLDMEWR